MKDQSLPSTKFEPKYKDTKRKTYVICYPMDMGNSYHGLVGLVTGRLDVSATKVLKAPIQDLAIGISNR